MSRADRDARSRRRASAGEAAQRRAAYRVFGSKPGAYGAGLQALIDEGGWNDRGDLADVYLDWGGYAYGGGARGRGRARRFRRAARATSMRSLHNQDNREHDLLDCDDYYQFEGGLARDRAELCAGSAPRICHKSTIRGRRRRVSRPLAEEIARVVRGRAANPKWIAGVMRHGYKGAFEIAATVDYLFAFAATTDAVVEPSFRSAVRRLSRRRARCATSWQTANPAALARNRRAVCRGDRARPVDAALATAPPI